MMAVIQYFWVECLEFSAADGTFAGVDFVIRHSLSFGEHSFTPFCTLSELTNIYFQRTTLNE